MEERDGHVKAGEMDNPLSYTVTMFRSSAGDLKRASQLDLLTVDILS